MEQEIKTLILSEYDENAKLEAVEMWANGINATVAPTLEKAKYFFRNESFDAIIVALNLSENDLFDFLMYVDQAAREELPHKKTIFLKTSEQLDLCGRLHQLDLISGFFGDDVTVEKICDGIKSGLELRKNQGKRSFPRFGVRLPGVIKVLGQDGIIEGEVRDLSAGGLSIHIDRKFTTKLRNYADIRFGVTIGGRGNQVVGDGNLTWFKDNDALDCETLVKVGVKFTSVNQSAKTNLAQFLNVIK